MAGWVIIMKNKYLHAYVHTPARVSLARNLPQSFTIKLYLIFSENALPPTDRLHFIQELSRQLLTSNNS